MYATVVMGQSVSGLKCFITHSAGVGHVKVHLHMPPHFIFLGHGLATIVTDVLKGAPLFFNPPYHGLQSQVEF